mgnify:CR=1 FL=1
MDRTPLTVFAPIDSSLSELLPKARLRSINLAELAKHHIGKCCLPLQRRIGPRLAHNSICAPSMSAAHVNVAALAKPAHKSPPSGRSIKVRPTSWRANPLQASLIGRLKLEAFVWADERGASGGQLSPR